MCVRFFTSISVRFYTWKSRSFPQQLKRLKDLLVTEWHRMNCSFLPVDRLTQSESRIEHSGTVFGPLKKKIPSDKLEKTSRKYQRELLWQRFKRSACWDRILRKVLSVWTEWLTWVTDALDAWFAPGWCTKRTHAKTAIKEIIIIIIIIIIMMMMMVINSICIKIGSWRLLIKYIVNIQLEKKTLCVGKKKQKKRKKKNDANLLTD